MQPGSNTVLVMTSSNRTCSLLREYLDELDLDAPKGEQGRQMMMRRLGGYLGWKADLHASKQSQAGPDSNKDKAPAQQPGSASTSGIGELSDAMKKKDNDRRDRAARRRRVRGGAPGTTSQRPQESEQEGMMKSEGLIMDEAEQIADL